MTLSFTLTAYGLDADVAPFIAELAGTMDYDYWLPVPVGIQGIVEGILLESGGDLYYSWDPGPPIIPYDADALWATYHARSEAMWKSSWWSALDNAFDSGVVSSSDGTHTTVFIVWKAYGGAPINVIHKMQETYPELTFTVTSP